MSEEIRENKVKFKKNKISFTYNFTFSYIYNLPLYPTITRVFNNKEVRVGTLNAII